ncbi:MAG: SDR family NAD(P)-dependent oxidoreductase [Actinomycetes bacterium]|jgi:3-oxoacyl-[acyl-carrier protein] reductase
MTYQLRDLKDQVIVITGATAGMGAATAKELVEQGAKVVLNARNEARLQEIVASLGADNAIYVAGDCSEPEVSRAIAKAALDKFGTIDAVVPNAGIGMYGSILDYSDDEVNRMMRTNYEGTVHIIRACLPTMVAKKAGDIVIVSSVAGFRGGGDESIYAGTKHAQVGLAGGLDRELREKGVRVALVCPAGTETEFAIGAGRTAGTPVLASFLRSEDIAFQITTILKQPRSVRTHIWTLWSINQQS